MLIMKNIYRGIYFEENLKFPLSNVNCFLPGVLYVDSFIETDISIAASQGVCAQISRTFWEKIWLSNRHIC